MKEPVPNYPSREHESNQEQRLRLMKQAALEAGAFIRDSTDRAHSDKSNKKDFVTVADIKSQDLLKHSLEASNPGVEILSEEDSEVERAKLFDPNFTGFVLDPIDGTYNFKRDMRESAISIGYVENGELVSGIVYDPFKEELYEASLNGGAFRNGKQIHVSENSDLAGASIATSNSYDSNGMRRNLERHLAIYDATGEMPWTSCPGSGVLIMVWVACGRIDAYHHNGLKPWDNVAAFLIAREAGAIVNTLHGDTANFTSNTVLMGNPMIVQKLETVFEQVDKNLLT